MRFARVVKLPLRSMTLGILFGAAVALTIPKAPAQEEIHANHECKDLSKCADYTWTGVCKDGAYCKGEGTIPQFYTCQPGGTASCVNSDSKYGHIGCSGKCQIDGNPTCNFTIYFCKNSP